MLQGDPGRTALPLCRLSVRRVSSFGSFHHILRAGSGISHGVLHANAVLIYNDFRNRLVDLCRACRIQCNLVLRHVGQNIEIISTDEPVNDRSILAANHNRRHSVAIPVMDVDKIQPIRLCCFLKSFDTVIPHRQEPHIAGSQQKVPTLSCRDQFIGTEFDGRHQSGQKFLTPSQEKLCPFDTQGYDCLFVHLLIVSLQMFCILAQAGSAFRSSAGAHALRNLFEYHSAAVVNVRNTFQPMLADIIHLSDIPIKPAALHNKSTAVKFRLSFSKNAKIVQPLVVKRLQSMRFLSGNSAPYPFNGSRLNIHCTLRLNSVLQNSQTQCFLGVFFAE